MDKEQKICVSAWVNFDTKVLLLRRYEKEEFLPGYYEMPGGKVNFGETPEQALLRECNEEAQISISPNHPYRVFSYVSAGGDRHTVDICYLVSLIFFDKQIVLSDAHDKFAWVEEKDVNKYLMTQEMLESVVQGFLRHETSE